MQVRLSENDAESQRAASQRPEPLHDPFAYFRAVLRGTLKPAGDLSSLENNLIVVEILDAARRSAKEGRTIRL